MVPILKESTSAWGEITGCFTVCLHALLDATSYESKTHNFTRPHNARIQLKFGKQMRHSLDLGPKSVI